MCTILLSILGSPFVLFSFVIELFILIGQLGNTDVLRDLYFLQTINKSQNVSYNFGLWNYCQGDANGVISECSKRVPAFNWAKAPLIAQALPYRSTSKMTQSLFLAMFILFFIGCGFSLIIWCFSVPFCCSKRRRFHFSITTFLIINFLIMLVGLILALVLVLGGIRELINADNTWEGHAGNLLWITIGAVVSLLVAFSIYSCGAYCARGERAKKVDPVVYKDEEKAPYYAAAVSPAFAPGQNVVHQGNIVYQQQPDGQYLPVVVDGNNSTLLQQAYQPGSPLVDKKGHVSSVQINK